jgi:hypothetical protein
MSPRWELLTTQWWLSDELSDWRLQAQCLLPEMQHSCQRVRRCCTRYKEGETTTFCKGDNGKAREHSSASSIHIHLFRVQSTVEITQPERVKLTIGHVHCDFRAHKHCIYAVNVLDKRKPHRWIITDWHWRGKYSAYASGLWSVWESDRRQQLRIIKTLSPPRPLLPEGRDVEKRYLQNLNVAAGPEGRLMSKLWLNV